MEDSKLLFMLDQDRTFLLSYLENPINKNTYEMSVINLTRHRMRYIWSSINLVTLTIPFQGPEQLWVTADYNRCFELFLSFSTKEVFEKKGKCPSLFISKSLSEKFDNHFCKIKFVETGETKTISNDKEFQTVLREWIKGLQQKKDLKRDNMLKKALQINRSQSATQLQKSNDNKKVHFSSPQIVHNAK